MDAARDMVSRLSNYRKTLYKMKALGFVKVFSDNLADALGISPAQVRKDFSMYELTGNKRGGYTIDELLEKLNKILGKNEIHKVIIVGCGRMGTALMNYNGFSRDRMKVVAGFDTDSSAVDPNARIPIYDLSELKEFVKKEGIKVAILAVPESPACEVIDILQDAGIRGVLNFAPIQLRGTESCIIYNINIVLELENMLYFVRKMEEQDLSSKVLDL